MLCKIKGIHIDDVDIYTVLLTLPVYFNLNMTYSIVAFIPFPELSYYSSYFLDLTVNDLFHINEKEIQLTDKCKLKWAFKNMIFKI